MKLPIALSLASFLALTGCDDGNTAPVDDAKSFRAEGGSGSDTFVREAERETVKKKGCEAIWWLMEEEGELISYEEAYDDWTSKIRISAEDTANLMLESYGAGGMCDAVCTEGGGKWNGEVSVVESWHEVGETEVVGECPFGTLATETEVTAMGAVGCGCAF